MPSFSATQRRAIMMFAILIGVVAIGLVGLRVAGLTALPPFIPILLIVAAVGIVAGVSGGSRAGP